MKAEGYSLAATVILLFPMLYFLLASTTFLLAKLSDPVVTWLLRGLFDTYFLAISGCSAFAVLAFAGAGRPGIAAGIGVIAAFAIGARRWFLRRIDRQIEARDAGDAHAPRELRRLHYYGMLYNVVQSVLVIASLNQIVPAS